MLETRKAVPHRYQVVLVAHERESDEVHTLFEADLEIGAVLVGKGWYPQVRLREIDPLAGCYDASDDDVTQQMVTGNLAHLQLHQSVREKNPLPYADVFEKVFVADREDPLRSLAVDPEGYGRSRPQLDSAFGQLAEPDFGSAEVLEDADLAASLLRDLADSANGLAVGLAVAVRKVEPDHVHSGLKESGDPVGRVGRRPQGADNLGLSWPHESSALSYLFPSRSPCPPALGKPRWVADGLRPSRSTVACAWLMASFFG